MKLTRKCWRYLAIPICWALCFGALSPQVALGYDTGHHSDLTRSVLQEEGFDDTAIKTAQLQNWLTDYYSNAQTDKVSGDIKTAKAELEKLHFDNLYSTAQVQAYWAHLTINAKAGITQAAKDGDTLKALTLLGASLHAVQDFYTHSNWVETHPREGNDYRVDTWFDNPPPDGMEIYTGYYPNEKKGAGREPHGAYDFGVNHDSYVRPRFDESYVFAYVAGRQWTDAMREWANEANPDFWASMQKYSIGDKDRNDLDRDLNAAFRISEWVALKGNNGHWKGSGSGSNIDFIPFSVAWIASPDSIFAKEMKKLAYRPLSNGLIDNDKLNAGEKITAPEEAVPAVPAAKYSSRVVILRTTNLAELPTGTFEPLIDSPGGKADFFAKISIGGQNFVEAMQLDRNSVNPSWMTIRFVADGSSVPVKYELWDEDTGPSFPDDLCDINPARGRSQLEFRYDVDSHRNEGDVKGVFDSTANTYKAEGAKPDKDRARMNFYITTHSLVKADGKISKQTESPACGNLGETQTLSKGQTLKSCNGRFRLTLQDDNNLVLYEGEKALWASDTIGKSVDNAVMQADGNLVLYKGSSPVWATKTDNNPGSFLSVQDDGNLVIYDANKKPIWASNTKP